MTSTEAPEAPEPGKFATAAIDVKLRDWRNAPAVTPVPLELHLLRVGIADFIDRERVIGKSYAEAHAALLAVVGELPAPSDPEADEAEVAAEAATLAAQPTGKEPEAKKEAA